MSRSVLSNCLFQSIYIRLRIPGSRIKMYHNSKYNIISFYVIVRGKKKITFKRDRTKPMVIKNMLFYINHRVSSL